jgi:hypothetical protein
MHAGTALCVNSLTDNDLQGGPRPVSVAIEVFHVHPNADFVTSCRKIKGTCKGDGVSSGYRDLGDHYVEIDAIQFDDHSAISHQPAPALTALIQPTVPATKHR